MQQNCSNRDYSVLFTERRSAAQLFMRHKDIRLTLETYDDQSHYELQSAVQALEATNLP